ncbi:MAG: hypothetical protein JXQ29_07170, partial [Planctomycetes bacterium]|nr:hypothetical protein [Planctomycetota bacterium]
ASPGRDYAVLASLRGFRPGLQLPDNTRRVISLAPDALFYLLVSSGNVPGVLENFRGLLDHTGAPPAATPPTVRLPAGLPRGTRVCFAAVAFNPLMATGLDVSNPWALIVE